MSIFNKNKPPKGPADDMADAIKYMTNINTGAVAASGLANGISNNVGVVSPSVTSQHILDAYEKAVKQMNSAAGMGYVGGAAGHSRDYPYTTSWGMQALMFRLHIKANEAMPFPFLSVFFTKDKALVFVVGKEEQYSVIEDDKALFPSDSLITALRLLEG